MKFLDGAISTSRAERQTSDFREHLAPERAVTYSTPRRKWKCFSVLLGRKPPFHERRERNSGSAGITYARKTVSTLSAVLLRYLSPHSDGIFNHAQTALERNQIVDTNMEDSTPLYR